MKSDGTFYRVQYRRVPSEPWTEFGRDFETYQEALEDTRITRLGCPGEKRIVRVTIEPTA